MSIERKTLVQAFDWPLFVAVVCVGVLGVVNLYSSTSSGHEVSDRYLAQVYWLSLGSAFAVVVTAIDYRYYERFAWTAYVFGLVLLLIVFLVAPDVRGSQRWIRLGGFSLQPSEPMKIFLIIALAKYLHDDPQSDGRTLRDLVVPSIILLVPMLLILKQPDLGTGLLCAFIFVSIMLLTNLKLRSMATLVGALIALAYPIWEYGFHDYQRRRFYALIDLHQTPPVLNDDNRQIHHSLVAIGDGGFWGRGFMRGTQNVYNRLPDRATDFAASVWAEEYGFVGVLILIALYVFIIVWALRIAATAKDRFGAVVCVGVSALFFWHTIVNLGMVTGLLPVVGVTLPLFSYGGSSVLTTMMGIGLLMNVSIRRTQF